MQALAQVQQKQRLVRVRAPAGRMQILPEVQLRRKMRVHSPRGAVPLQGCMHAIQLQLQAQQEPQREQQFAELNEAMAANGGLRHDEKPIYVHKQLQRKPSRQLTALDHRHH